jgi:two-component system response regulator HydG
MSESPTASATTIRVLIVDNDPALAQTMAESLERVGYPCDVATSGPDGVRHIGQDTYDVIITDLVMNDVDGMEVLVRAKQYLPDAEVIMVTGHASVPKAVEAMQQGAFNFLEKPITPNRLRAVAQQAAGRTFRIRRHYLHQRQHETGDRSRQTYCTDRRDGPHHR